MQPWPNGVVPYEISSSDFNQDQKNLIVKNIKRLEQLVGTNCIEFKERTNEQNYVEYKQMQGCTSFVGMQGGKQDISIGGEGCLHDTQITHESLHALGFGHEHSRPDRDQYISIKWENVDPNQKDAFRIEKNSNNMINTFDFGSVMLYPRNGFSANGGDTVQSKIQGFSVPREQPILSESDVQRVRALYKCS